MPGLWKADIKAAFRRIPIKKAHTWAAAVVFKAAGKASACMCRQKHFLFVCALCKVWVSVHKACPFGALSSVHGWERLGRLITTLARRVLFLPVQRYVDDLFAPEHPDSLEHAMLCFARFTRILLGPDAIEERKLEHGKHLIVLGTMVELSWQGYVCRPAAKTVIKCLRAIEVSLQTGVMSSGDAQKLAGRLSWSTQRLFRRLGRAMLRPIYLQKFSRHTLVCFALL